MFHQKIFFKVILSTFISITSGIIFAKEHEYSDEDWYGGTEVSALNVAVSDLKKDNCAYSDNNLTNCKNHLLKIENLYDDNKLNRNSINYTFEKVYEDKLMGNNAEMIISTDLGVDIVYAAIKGKQIYFERILKSSKFLEIESSDHLHASQFTEMRNNYFTNKSIRPLFAQSTCRLEGYFMMGGSGQPLVELNCYYKLGSNYLTLISDLINEVEGRVDEISNN